MARDDRGVGRRIERLRDIPKRTVCGECGARVPLRARKWEVFPDGAVQAAQCHCGAHLVAIIGTSEFAEAAEALWRESGQVFPPEAVH